MIRRVLIAISIALLLYGCTEDFEESCETLTLSQDDTTWSITSPNGNITISLDNDNSLSQLYYNVTFAGEEIISNSLLGITINDINFSKSLEFQSLEKQSISERYSLPVGKTSSYTNHCNQIELIFEKMGYQVGFQLRVYDDGIAYRYKIYGSGEVNIAPDLLSGSGEYSEICVNNFQSSWAMAFTKSYEGEYHARSWTELVAVTSSDGEGNQTCVPMLLKNSSGLYMLLHEAGVTGTYSAARLSADDNQKGLLRFVTPNEVTSELPLETPWRMAIIGDLPSIFSSTMTENLNPSTDRDLSDYSFVKPGIGMWNWGPEETYKPNRRSIIVEYIDFVSQMGWDYFLIDAGWDQSEGSVDFTIPEMVQYAVEKGVEIWLWFDQNEFTEESSQIKELMQTYKDIGVVGLKIDYWALDSYGDGVTHGIQVKMQRYDKVIEAAAEVGLMLNMHGCKTPTGTRRKWPHLMTHEAVYGNEHALTSLQGIPNTAEHNITICLTRNVIGAMDYSPVDLLKRSGEQYTNVSVAHNFAQMICYESAVQFMMDHVDALDDQLGLELLRYVPAAWDESRLLEGCPNEYVTIARRSGDEWFVGSMTSDARNYTLMVDFLDAGKTMYANIYRDGDMVTEVEYEVQEIQNGDTIEISMIADGGFALHIADYPHCI